MKLIRIIRKNLKLLFQSKFTSFVVLFGPLLVILLVGYAFNNFNGYKIQVGTYSENYSQLAKEYIVEMSDSSFKVVKYPNKNECIEDIKYGGIHTCLVFPNDFDILNKNNTLEFYVDPSNVNLVWMVIDEVSKKIKARSSKVSLNITEDIISRVEKSKNSALEGLNIIKNISSELNSTNNTLVSAKNKLKEMDFDIDASTSMLNTATIDTTVTTLHTNAKKAEDNLNNLINDIKNSNTWSQLNSTQESELNDLFDSATNSMDSLITTIDGDYATFSSKLEALTISMFNLTSSINSFKDKLSDLEGLKDSVNQKIDLVVEEVNDLNSGVILLQKNFRNIYSDLSSIKMTNARSIVSPVSTSIIPVVKDESHLNYLYPALIILIIMFIGLLLSSLNIVLEKNSRAFFRNFVTPTSDTVFLIASFLSSMFVIIVQIFIILAFSYLLFDTKVIESLALTSLILLLTSTFFVVLGMIVGYIFSTEEAAILGTISLSSILFFVSDLVVPISALPEGIKFIIDLNPFIITTGLLKRSLLFNVPFEVLKPNIVMFSFYILGAGITLFIIHKFAKIRQFYYNAQKHKKIDVIEKSAKNKTGKKASKKAKKNVVKENNKKHN